MRRLVFVVGGTARAATLACNGGGCVGGDGPDTMYGSGVRDEIHSLKGVTSSARTPAGTSSTGAGATTGW